MLGVIPRNVHPLAATSAPASDRSCIAAGQGVCALSNALRPIQRPGRCATGWVSGRPFPGTAARCDEIAPPRGSIRCITTDAMCGAVQTAPRARANVQGERLAPWAVRGATMALPRPSASAGCPFLVRPAGFVTEPGAATRRCGSGPLQRSLFLARKRGSAMPVKRMRTSRAARSPSGKLALLAHPRLVHGFLVRLPASSTISAEYAKRPSCRVPRRPFPATPPPDGLCTVANRRRAAGRAC